MIIPLLITAFFLGLWMLLISIVCLKKKQVEHIRRIAIPSCEYRRARKRIARGISVRISEFQRS